MAQKNSIVPAFERAKRAFLLHNATPQEQADLRGKPVKEWPTRLRKAYKASRR